jgi:futalosine hydrolase
MKILLVSATTMEVKMFLNECRFLKAANDNLKTYEFDGVVFDLLLTGLGTTFTAFHLTTTLHKNAYRIIINAGIAGTLSDELHIGDVVNVVDEEFADLGIEEETDFLTLFDSGFMQPDEFPFENRILRSDRLPYVRHLARVKGITANVSHGRRSSVAEIKSRFTAKVESMEGAAIFYVCRWFGMPFMQIRAISNYVAPRAEAQWDIPLALENLKNTLSVLLREIG